MRILHHLRRISSLKEAGGKLLDAKEEGGLIMLPRRDELRYGVNANDVCLQRKRR